MQGAYAREDGKFSLKNITPDRPLSLKGQIGGQVRSLCGLVDLQLETFDEKKASATLFDRKQQIASLAPLRLQDLEGRWSNICFSPYGTSMTIRDGSFEV